MDKKEFEHMPTRRVNWAKYIKKLVENPDLITLLQNNLYEFVKDRYNINNVTAKRAEWYKSINKKGNS